MRDEARINISSYFRSPATFQTKMAAFARGRFHSNELISLLCKCKLHSDSSTNSTALALSKGCNTRLLQRKYKFGGRWQQQVAYYYVKKKEKKGQSTSLAWAALGGVTCGLIIGAVGILGNDFVL